MACRTASASPFDVSAVANSSGMDAALPSWRVYCSSSAACGPVCTTSASTCSVQDNFQLRPLVAAKKSTCLSDMCMV